jgi:hypothetical protein
MIEMFLGYMGTIWEQIIIFVANKKSVGYESVCIFTKVRQKE